MPSKTEPEAIQRTATATITIPNRLMNHQKLQAEHANNPSPHAKQRTAAKMRPSFRPPFAGPEINCVEQVPMTVIFGPLIVFIVVYNLYTLTVVERGGIPLFNRIAYFVRILKMKGYKFEAQHHMLCVEVPFEGETMSRKTGKSSILMDFSKQNGGSLAMDLWRETVKGQRRKSIDERFGYRKVLEVLILHGCVCVSVRACVRVAKPGLGYASCASCLPSIFCIFLFW